MSKNYYLDIVDYELEVEYQEGFKEEAFSFLKSIQNIIGDQESVSTSGGKRDRFFFQAGTSIKQRKSDY